MLILKVLVQLCWDKTLSSWNKGDLSLIKGALFPLAQRATQVVCQHLVRAVKFQNVNSCKNLFSDLEKPSVPFFGLLMQTCHRNLIKLASTLVTLAAARLAVASSSASSSSAASKGSCHQAFTALKGSWLVKESCGRTATLSVEYNSDENVYLIDNLRENAAGKLHPCYGTWRSDVGSLQGC